MNLSHVLVAALAVAGVQQVAVGQMNQVSMCVTTAIGTCGSLCQPFDCTPNYTLVSSHEQMRFEVAGAPYTPYVLFVGIAVPGCLPVPGIEGAMATWTPASAFWIGEFTDKGLRSDLPCQPGTDVVFLTMPVVPVGLDVRYQLLGLNNMNGDPILTFSRPTEVRTR